MISFGLDPMLRGALMTAPLDEGPEYDEEFAADLETVVLPHLRTRDFAAVADTPERFNTCVRFALKYGLRYDWNPDTAVFLLRPVDGSERVAYSPPQPPSSR